jgi:hypothetical protein
MVQHIFIINLFGDIMAIQILSKGMYNEWFKLCLRLCLRGEGECKKLKTCLFKTRLLAICLR